MAASNFFACKTSSKFQIYSQGGRESKTCLFTDGKTTVCSLGISSEPFAKQDFSSWRENTGVNVPQCRNTTTLFSKMMFGQTPR